MFLARALMSYLLAAGAAGADMFPHSQCNHWFVSTREECSEVDLALDELLADGSLPRMKLTNVSLMGPNFYMGVDAKGPPSELNGPDFVDYVCRKPVWRKLINGAPTLQVVMTYKSAEEDMTIVRQIAFIEDCEAD
jgi:hypothetical protein